MQCSQKVEVLFVLTLYGSGDGFVEINILANEVIILSTVMTASFSSYEIVQTGKYHRRSFFYLSVHLIEILVQKMAANC